MELAGKSSECNKTEKMFNSRLDKHWENQDIQSTCRNFEILKQILYKNIHKFLTIFDIIMYIIMLFEYNSFEHIFKIIIHFTTEHPS